MVESRWLRWVGPGLIALSAVGLIASTTDGAGPRVWAPRPCPGASAERVVAARDRNPRTPADLAAAPWFRLDAVAAADGSLRGERLVLGRFGDPLTRALDLPAESFAAGPFGGIVLAGSDDGSASRLEMVDIGGGCSWAVGTERDVIRRATIDPSGTAIYEMRVDRATRADLGIWRRPVDSGAVPVRILDPIAPDARFGRTFSTEFMWDLDGDRLAVQSCGEFACRTRLIDPQGGATPLLDQPDLGLLIGVDGDSIVTYADCHGLPCPIVSTDITTGERHTVADAAGAATLIPSDAGARLVLEMPTATGTQVRSLTLDGSRSATAAAIPSDIHLAGTPLSGGSDMRVPAGWVLLAPDGRLPLDPMDHRPQLRRIKDGATVRLDEAFR